MKRNVQALLCLLLLGVAQAGFAGTALGIRLVEASNRGKGVAQSLGNVAPLLRNNMPFDTYQLLTAKSVSLPANATMDMGYGLVVRCSGPQKNLSVSVLRRGKTVLQSTVEVKDRSPVILGGFPAEGGKMILILLAQ
jgi:hypothetical protein